MECAFHISGKGLSVVCFVMYCMQCLYVRVSCFCSAWMWCLEEVCRCFAIVICFSVV